MGQYIASHKLEEASTHLKSAKMHAGNVFLRDLDL